MTARQRPSVVLCVEAEVRKHAIDMLDSAIDYGRDVEEGSQSMVDWYGDEAAMVQQIGTLAACFAGGDSRIPGGGYRRVFTVGIAAYHLSAPTADVPPCDAIKAQVVRELRPLIFGTLGMFRLWGMVKAAC